MTVENKKVTLYVPCYNAERYIAECLKGVLKQTYPIDEILIIDDGSTDGTAEIASKYPVKIIRHEINKGLAAARNSAFLNARNEYVAALDADCVPEPDWLEKLMRNFEDDDIAGVGGKLVEKYTDTIADKWRAVHMRQHWGDVKIINPPFLLGCNNVLRKDAVMDIGGYYEKFRTNEEDFDLCMRLMDRRGKIVYEPVALVYHLRRDTFKSVLHTYWRYGSSTVEINKILFIKRFVGNFLLGFRLAREDLFKYNFDLIGVDVLLPIIFCKIDMQKVLSAKSKV